jgi:hypothetical protein
MAETKLQNRLKRLGACEEAVKWVADRDFAAAWTECQRADWMLWLCGWMAGKAGWPTREQIVLVCCRIAEDALPIYEEKYPNDKRVRECIEVTRRWAKGKATIEEVRKARDAARAAAHAATAHAATAHAATATATDAAAAAHSAAFKKRSEKLKEYAEWVRQELVPGELYWLRAGEVMR